MTDKSCNLVELIIKAFGPVLVLAGLVFGVIQFQSTAEQDRKARETQYNQTLIEAKREAKKPFYEQQLALYLEVTDVTGQIYSPRNDKDREAAIARFWQLYWGPLAMVESQEVESAMVDFGRILEDKELTDAKRATQLKRASINLAHQCRESLVNSWKVDLPQLSGK